MVDMGLNVPPAFCITTRICNQFMDILAKFGAGSPEEHKFVSVLMQEVLKHDAWLTETMGYAPLVSVRSGAPVSMPGMMDTILNVGLTHHNLNEWIERIGERAAWDSYRRLIQMLGSTAYDIDMGVFDFQLARVKKDVGATEDTQLGANDLKVVVVEYEKAFAKAVGHTFPATREEQLKAAIGAVFNSWGNDRAIEYRKINKIDPAMGTACNVQAMVFGNLNDQSGTGVLFTRDPSTGENVIMGEFLPNAQGEDVVAGIRTPLNITKMQEMPAPWPVIANKIAVVCGDLEAHYNDMVDIEFTVQDGVLYILQSRVGKRSAFAAFKIAIDLVTQGKIVPQDAIKRLTRAQFKLMRRPTIDPKYKGTPDAVGLPACPGVAVGRPVYSSADAVSAKDPVILVTHETDPDDIAGMNKAQGILTATGGATSHAAVVARAMDKPCVVGCTGLDIHDMQKSKITKLTICGSTGRVWAESNVPIIDASDSVELNTVRHWAQSITGYAESMSFPEDIDRPIMLHAADWWDDESEMEVAIDGIAEWGKASTTILDLAHPQSFAYIEDSVLADAFQTAKPLGEFAKTVIDYVINLGTTDALKGLTILNAPLLSKGTLKSLSARGVFVSTAPATVADLLNGAGAPTKDFIANIIGGDEAWAKLQDMLKTAGVETKVVPQAAPADYAVFQVLT
jgi:pyruvate,orthophosphate dikinase